jgi:acyl-CoA synthetase (AMP-forming)/AMP-acid ligase II
MPFLAQELETMNWNEDELAAAGLSGSATRVPVPGAIQSVAEVLDPWLLTHGDRVALIGRHRSLTFRQLDQEVNSAAAYLSSLGVERGSRVAASLGNHPEIVVAFLAAQRLGAIWVGVNLAYSPVEKAYMLKDAGASVLLALPDVIDALRAAQVSPGSLRMVSVAASGESDWSAGLGRCAGAARPDVPVDPWAPAGIAYTSGTTGRPKGAVHSQHNMIVAAQVTEELNGYRSPDAVRATASPLTILNMMIGGPVSALANGNRHVCCDRIDIEGIAEWIRSERINTMALVPTIIRDLLTSPKIDQQELSSLKWVVIGAAMVPEGMPELYESRFGHKPTVGYGLTEAPTVVSRTHDLTPRTPGAIGRAAPHLEVAILDDDCRPVPTAAEGEICARATQSGKWAGVYTPPLGYWNKPDETRKLLRGGWLHTGDIGKLDEEGELYIGARRSDLIVRGGANIYPAEVERVLLQNSKISDCAVFGRPDERLGEIVVAVLEADPAHDRDRLIEETRNECLRQLAKYKVPVEWHVLEALPRNAMGKTLKPELKKLLQVD